MSIQCTFPFSLHLYYSEEALSRDCIVDFQVGRKFVDASACDIFFLLIASLHLAIIICENFFGCEKFPVTVLRNIK